MTDEPAEHPDRRKYRDKRTERFVNGERVREFEGFKVQAERRLDVLRSATTRLDLVSLNSNHFEALGGNRHGQFSVRINKQWRICFEWPDGQSAPFNIEIVDYH